MRHCSLLFLLLVLLVIISCCSSSLSQDGLTQQFQCFHPPLPGSDGHTRHFYRDNQARALRIVVSRRPESLVVGWMLRLLLHEVLGYAHTSIVQLDSWLVEGSHQSVMDDRCSRNWASLNCGRFLAEETDIVVDAWTMSDVNMNDVLAHNHVQRVGRLGPELRMGWFVSRNHVYMECRQWYIDHWRSFLEPHVINLFNFSTHEHAAVEHLLSPLQNSCECVRPWCVAGMYVPEWCRAAPCAVLLASCPDEMLSFVLPIKHNKLMVRVLWLGTWLDEVIEQRLNKSLPVLAVYFSPSTMLMRHQFSQVTFADCTRHSCLKSPVITAHKLAWPGLVTGASVADKALRLFQVDQEVYEQLLHAMLHSDGRNASQLACDWLSSHVQHWVSRWLPFDRAENIITIGGIFPLSGIEYISRGLPAAAVMAYEAINSNKSVLPNFKLSMVATDGQCSADMVMKNFIDFLRLPSFNHMVGIIGPACSGTVEPLAGVSRHYRVMVISYSAEGAMFNNRSLYPYFFRTIGENRQFRFVYKQLFEAFGWTRVASLTESGHKYSQYISLVQDELEDIGITFIANRKIQADSVSHKQYLHSLILKGARIIIADLYETQMKNVMCEAFKLGMTAKQGFVWFLPEWFPTDWYRMENVGDHWECTTDQMLQVLDGHLSLSHSYYANDSDIMQEGITVREWRRRYAARCSQYPVQESNYAGYTYDAVWTYALALDTLLSEYRSHYDNFHTDNATSRLIELLQQTDFHGVSGHIKFVGASRTSVMHVKQWRHDHYQVIGHFEPQPDSADGGRLYLKRSSIVWLTRSGSMPGHGVSSDCELQRLAEFLHSSCETAMIVVNMLSLSCAVAVMTVMACLFKMRYERKARLKLSLMHKLQTDAWELSRDVVLLNRKLGEGAFGTVYGGEALLSRDRLAQISSSMHKSPCHRTSSSTSSSSSLCASHQWVSVAVKTLKLNSTNEQKFDYLDEIDAMKQFRHDNIVQLLGVCTRSEPMLSVMEFVLYGDLKTFLLARRSLVSSSCSRAEDGVGEVCSGTLTGMARDIASALQYLASLKYVHRDVACRNCLVSANYTVKLADFGMGRFMCENDYYRFMRKGMLPVRWMAPESLTEGTFTCQSDMWSFGVVLYEITTLGSHPFSGLTNKQVVELVTSGGHQAVPERVKRELGELMLSCWSRDARQRPCASSVVQLLAVQFPRLISSSLSAPLSSCAVTAETSAAVSPPSTAYFEHEVAAMCCTAPLSHTAKHNPYCRFCVNATSL